jgi:hypothetical protein
VRVNERFAEAVDEVAAEGATVWVQDYQLQLLPAALRERRPDLRIGFFLHIPFPPIELFMQLPWRKRIIEGLLGADLVGFHTTGGARNFRALATRLTDATAERGSELRYGRRSVRVGAFPISIDARALDELARTPEVQDRAKAIRAELGDPEHLVLGVDRLDYTKGITVRLRAFEELLNEGRADDTVMIQIATPSRERVDAYQRLKAEVEQAVGRINGEHSSVAHPVLHYLHQSLPRDQLAAFFAAADVMLVTPLRDGMNLVAKEYVASRVDYGGGLICRNTARRIAQTVGIDLTICCTGYSGQVERISTFANSIGAKFVPIVFKEPQAPDIKNAMMFEVESKTYRHVDEEFSELLDSTGADTLVVDYLYSAMYIPSAFKRRSLRRVTVTLNREVAYARDLRLRGMLSGTSVLKLFFYEQMIYSRSNCVIALTSEDLPAPRPMTRRFVVPAVFDPKIKRWNGAGGKSLFFVGNAAAMSFGPLMRFMYGDRFAARRIGNQKRSSGWEQGTFEVPFWRNPGSRIEHGTNSWSPLLGITRA